MFAFKPKSPTTEKKEYTKVALTFKNDDYQRIRDLARHYKLRHTTFLNQCVDYALDHLERE